jgi:hypothetical protein
VLVSDSRAKDIRSLPLVADIGLEDSSPFGVQGLSRESIQMLKATSIKPLAAALALSGTREQIRDPALMQKILARNESWAEDFCIVRLIERSLWFSGQSDFVMRMMKNPSQIPDNPPAEVQAALTKAYALHPDATVWYGVPLFGDVVTSDGLPVPLTASQVKQESLRRLAAAQDHAASMGWLYRSLLRLNRLPGQCRDSIRSRIAKIWRSWERSKAEFRQARKDAKTRARAMARARFEYYRTGKVTTVVPEHSTRVGGLAAKAARSLATLEQSVGRSVSFTEEFMDRHSSSATGLAVLPFMALQIVPLFVVPATLVAFDPFLFIELPDEPGKLRMLGHWYWQQMEDGTSKLHVHV